MPPWNPGIPPSMLMGDFPPRRHNVPRAVKSALGWDVLSCLVLPWGLRKPLSSKAQSVFLRVGEGEGLSRGLEAMWEV